jgi:hypothetical protein
LEADENRRGARLFDLQIVDRFKMQRFPVRGAAQGLFNDQGHRHFIAKPVDVKHNEAIAAVDQFAGNS